MAKQLQRLSDRRFQDGHPLFERAKSVLFHVSILAPAPHYPQGAVDGSQPSSFTLPTPWDTGQ